MFSVLAILAYLVAMAIPVYVLCRFQACHWSWHVLAVILALTLGLIPLPAGVHGAGFDLLFGFIFIALMVWGVGGLVAFHSGHHEKHA